MNGFYTKCNTELKWVHMNKVFKNKPSKICGRLTTFKKIKRVWAASSRPYPFKIFKDCLPNFTWSILENFVTYGCLLLLLLFFFFFGNVQTNEMAPNCHITDILTIPLTYLKIFKSSNTSFISIPFKNNAEPPGATFNFSNS